MLAQLLYFSKVRDLGECGVVKLLNQCREKNSVAHLSGALLFDQKYFFQCLEGGREELTETFSRIAADRRHGRVTLMSFRDIDERDFPDWTMGYISTTPALKKFLLRFFPTEEFTPQSLSSASATTLMRSLREMQFTVA